MFTLHMSHMADGEKGRKGQTIKDWIVAIKELSTPDSELKSGRKEIRLKWLDKQSPINWLTLKVILAFIIQISSRWINRRVDNFYVLQTNYDGLLPQQPFEKEQRPQKGF